MEMAGGIWNHPAAASQKGTQHEPMRQAVAEDRTSEVELTKSSGAPDVRLLATRFGSMLLDFDFCISVILKCPVLPFWNRNI